ncbi:mitogen-activated protein kinase-binding protein 1-like isoform X2 [Hydractinia symbiolongicarpus]|uniref:mitogen-activated protein kinase-binding protein 1-like isoform X2 n=1 Tax=Hydractinia symbiolongicarpus TaxID=13093 RepID=UPI00254EA7AC|nr:mitogen-activated protein kinase-binding protein 1-like isoform X2 [Hydractinia symbiolongicarpus]
MRKSSGGLFSKLTPTRKLNRKSASRQDLRSLGEKVSLSKVLGLTTTNTNGLASNPVSGVVAYPAGCVIVLYNPKTKKQSHIFNPDKKTITCLAFSSDGRYLVSGESGQQPSVRVWELGESIAQVAELRGHKSGITCVEFSPNQKLLVSIGDQHDMLVNVWNWKLGHTVACNKSGCRVRAVSFAEDGQYLVTVGNRHVKFWYLDAEASSKGNVPITPITGRSGILGEQRNNCFTDVMCGRGRGSKFTFCVTKSGLLCMFSEKRILDKWVELKAGSANCLMVTEEYIFCGCSNGFVRVFDPTNLKFITTLPRPHNLGVNVSDGVTPNDLVSPGNTKHCPDLVAISMDLAHFKLTSIYNDHSLYIWDVHDVKKVGKTASFLYHSACIWGVETYPVFDEHSSPCLPSGSFLTCSSDDTIRIWNLESGSVTNKVYPRNLYSKELLKVVYIDEGLTHLQDTSMAPFSKDSDSKNGVRCMQISPDGQVIATGDRSGNIRLYDMQFFDELIRIEAHESEILCVEFSTPDSGFNLLASSSRDRLVHIFDMRNDYTLLQTIDDHSSSITAVRFNYDLGMLQLLSCGADKVVMFHTAQVSDNGNINFIRNTIVPGKATLYDMGIEPTRKYAATVGQDRNLRIYDIQGAKQLYCYKGSISEEGNLIKFQLDSAGVYAAVSCSDKTIGIFDFEHGECEAAVYGHSELVTGLKFTADGEHMISVSGDGCIFVWKLPSIFTENIHNRLHDLHLPIPQSVNDDNNDLRRKTFVVPASRSLDYSEQFSDATQVIDNVPGKSPVGYRFSVGQLPLWAQKQIGAGDDVSGGNKGLSQPLGRWGERTEGGGLTTVQEIGNKIDYRKYSNSQDSTESMGSDKSNCHEGKDDTQADIIYPLVTDDSLQAEADRTFRVTETQRDRTSSHNLAEQSEIVNGVNGNGSNSDEDSPSEGVLSPDADSEDEAFSPLVEHFEKLATPVAGRLLSRQRTNSSGENDVEKPFQPGHRASISAKFLSRSQRSSRNSASTVTAEDQRKRIEAARDTISSNLKKSKLMSKSCQNLSFGQEFDQQRSNHIKNHILSSPSLSSVQDLGAYDPRRSSTPLHKNPPNRDDKNKRRSASNAWVRGPVVSPLASPVRYNRTQSQQGKDSPSKHNNNLTSKTRHSSENILSEKYNDGVPRRSENKNRPRPKSLMVDAKAEREFFEQMKAEEASHSDNEIDIKSNLRKFTDANDTRPSPELSPVRSLVRNFDIDEQMAGRLDATYDSKAPNIGKMAAEINSNMTSLTMQALKQHADGDASGDEPHAGTSKRLIQLYESGVLMNGNIHQESPPPMRKSSSSHDENENHINDDVQQTNLPNGVVTMDDCQTAMRNLVQSYSEATQLHTKVLNQPSTALRKELLSLVSRTYLSIENSMNAQRKYFEGIDDISNHSNGFVESETFKDLQNTLTVTTATTGDGSTIEMFNLLDKYSNVLVDMIASKMKNRETLIE